MTELHAEIRRALTKAAKGLPARQMLAECEGADDIKEIVQEVHVLKGDGKVLADGMRDSQVVYKIGTWPANGKAVAPAAEVIKAEPVKAKHTITTLREGLFEMQSRLRAGQVDVQTAKTYAALSMTIIKSVEVQLDYEQLRLEAKLPRELTDVPLVPALEDKR